MAESETFHTNSREKTFDQVFGEDSTDFKFQFVDAVTDSVVEIRVHKQVLASNSSIFAALFKENWSTIHGITVTDASSAAFECFMEYFYKDRITVTMANVLEIVSLAHKYDVHHLAFNCEVFMSDRITSENVFDYYLASTRFDLNLLKIHCEKFFREQPERVLKAPAFVDCAPATLAAFLRNLPDSCDIAGVFDAVIEWAKRACRQSGRDPDDMIDVRAELGASFELIRFEQMTFEAITGRYKMLTAMFTKPEMDDIFERVLEHINHRYVKPLNGKKLELRGKHFLDVDKVEENLTLKVSKTLILHSITAAETWRGKKAIGFSADVRVLKGETKLFECSTKFAGDRLQFVLPAKIVFQAGNVYTIVVYRPDESVTVDGYLFKRQRVGDVEFVPMAEQTDIESAKGITCAISAFEFIQAE